MTANDIDALLEALEDCIVRYDYGDVGFDKEEARFILEAVIARQESTQ